MNNRTSIVLLVLLSATSHAQMPPGYAAESIPFFRMLCNKTETIKRDYIVSQEASTIKEHKKSDWLLMVYMAADNNLNYFAWHNIKQMATSGSNDNITIVIQLNEPGANKKTQRYLIEQNKALLLNEAQVATGQKCNTGDPQTLINFCTEVIQQFPANHIALVLWDHGTGYLDPFKAKVINPQELFKLNPSDMMLELNRTEEDLIEQINCDGHPRGICFDETYHSYLTNQKVDYALKNICTKMNRKFDIIGLDACLMQMLEFGCLLQPYAEFMVGSQEVELGAGWNYKYVLAPFCERSFNSQELAEHIVVCYQKAYSRVTHDYTLSSARLREVPALAQNIQTVSLLLQDCLHNQINTSVKSTIASCRAKKNCTCFDEPSYIDLGHFYKNILSNLGNLRVKNQQTIEQLRTEINKGLAILESLITAKVTGKNLIGAHGLSIYFPEKIIHGSYPKTPFAATNNWVNFIQEFVR